MAFTPVRQARASAEIVSQIETAIFAGELTAGDKLESERELAERFGVSRITVRDALRVLEAHGLVRVKVGASGGAFVAIGGTQQVSESIETMIKLKQMTLHELAEARKVVDAAVAELAAMRADKTDIESLSAVVEQGSHVVREEQPHAQASMDFHVALAQLCGNEVLAATVRAYQELLVPPIRQLRDARNAREVQTAHETILAAVMAHDSTAARQAMLDHLSEFEKRLRRWVPNKERER